MECLGVEGTLSVIPLTSVIGWGASVEMIGPVRILTLLSLSFTDGGVTLAIGVIGNCESIFIGLKDSEDCDWNFPSFFPWLGFSL